MTTRDAPSRAAGPAHRQIRATFQFATVRDAAGVPRVPADFVAQQGQHVRILDVRDEADLCGPLGHIPAVTHVPLEKVGQVPAILGTETPVVVVSRRGGRAGSAARMLEELGMDRVAAMDGGMMAWKQLGFATMRDPASYRKKLVALAPGIGRDGRPLVALAPGAKLTAKQIAGHIGDATTVRWVKLGAFLLHGKRSCVDGRDDHGVVGVPGGDAGELLLGLAAIEQVTGHRYTPGELARVLQNHVDVFGRFYMHTDLAMNDLVVEGYRKDPRIAPHVQKLDSPADWREFHHCVPEPLRDAVLEHLVKPEVMGCGHLRFAMTTPDYGMRPALGTAFLEAFHRLRWAGAPELEWVVLDGTHNEGAVANVVVEGELHSYTRVPLISPNVGGAQMFVNHPQVTAFLRRELVAYLAETAPSPVDEAKLADLIEKLGATQTAQSLGRLAHGLPVFEIRFARDGRATVEARGTIP